MLPRVSTSQSQAQQRTRADGCDVQQKGQKKKRLNSPPPVTIATLPSSTLDLNGDAMLSAQAGES